MNICTWAPEEGFGRAHMDTSCSAAVGARFDRALALLHNFWYVRALEQFNQVAKNALGDSETAEKRYEQFLALWKTADPDRPELAEAREFLNGILSRESCIIPGRLIATCHPGCSGGRI